MPLVKLAIPVAELSWAMVVMAALFNSLSSSIAKHRLNSFGPVNIFPLKTLAIYLYRFLRSPLIWVAVVLFVASPFLWFASLNALQLGVAYPSIYSLNLLFIFIFSVFFLKEKITAGKIAGAFFLVLAFYLFYGN